MDDEVDQVLEPSRADQALIAHAEASKMLEAALQQMDGIIAGKKTILPKQKSDILLTTVMHLLQNTGTQQELRKLSASQPPVGHASVKEALDQLQLAVQLTGADKRHVYAWILELLELVRTNIEPS